MRGRERTEGMREERNKEWKKGDGIRWTRTGEFDFDRERGRSIKGGFRDFRRKVKVRRTITVIATLVNYCAIGRCCAPKPRGSCFRRLPIGA